MSILSIFKKNKINDTTVRDRILDCFDFLCKDWGYTIIDSFSPYRDKNKDVVIYQNKDTNIQIDISANRDTGVENRLNMEFTKLLYGIVDYSDIDNSFSHYTLLNLDNSEQSSDYFGWNISQVDLLNKGAKLLIKHKDFFTSLDWISLDLHEQLRDYAIKKGFDYNTNWKPFVFPYYKTFRFWLNDLLTKNGYTLSYDSKALPSYPKDNINDKLEYIMSKQILSIRQHDYRDDSDTYSVYLNGKFKFTFKLIGDKTADKAIKEIEKIIK